MATKTYKKFLTGAATAAMVASAVAPVAAQGQDVAQTSHFTDVGLDDYFMEITEANELGFVSGYDAGPNAGKFLPYQKISRGHVVKILAKYVLQSKGMTLSEYNAKYDLKSVESFSDLSDNHPDQELVNYSKIVKNEGIFEGSNNNLMHTQNIKRQQIASVLVRAFKLQDKEGTPNLTDLDQAWDSHAKAVEIFAENGVTDQTTFRPNEDANRGQFTAFLMRAYKVSQGLSPEKPLSPIESVETLGDITINIGETPDLPETVTVTHENGLKSQANVEWDTTSLNNEAVGTYPLTGDVEGTDLTAKINVIVKEAPSVDAAVVSAQSLNSKQVLVKFNREVGTGAGSVENYDARIAPDGEVNNVVDASVQSDGKSVVLTLANGYRVSTDVLVTVDNVYVEDSIKDTFPKFSSVVTFNDTVAPSVTSVTATTNTNAAQVATVKFSEPIVNAGEKAPVFKIDGQVVTATPADNTGTVFTISGLSLATDDTHTLEVIGYEDFAENKVAISTQTFTVTKDATNAKGQVSVVQDNKIAVKFDKEINLSSVEDNIIVTRFDDATKTYVNVDYKPSLTGDNKTVILNIENDEKEVFFGLNDNTEELTVKVNKDVIDINGNSVTPLEEKVTVTQDFTKPALADVTFSKNSKGEVEKLYFHFNEVLAKSAEDIEDTDLSAKLTIVDKETNQTIQDNSTILGADATVDLAADNRTLVVTVDNADNKLQFGTYEFTIDAGLVEDDSFNPNKNVKGSKTVNFGARQNQVVVDTATATDNEVTVQFSSPVTAASATNPANYAINGTTLPEGTIIVVDADTATFEIPEGVIPATDAEAVLTVKNIKPQNSAATFNDYVGTISVIDNTRPVVSGQVLKNGVIQLTFSEALDVEDVNENDFNNVVLNGKSLTNGISADNKDVIELPDGTTAVTIEVPATETAAPIDGYSYLYIDVNGNGQLDRSGDVTDIILEQVEGAAPDWSTVADLNKLNSVSVTVVAEPTTADKAGNTIASKTVKVK